MTGSATGALIGFGIGGPVGAAAGTFFGPAIAGGFMKIGHEIKYRFLGPREEVRIGAVVVYTSNKIQEKLKSGEKIHDDNFFTQPENGRSAYEEVLEGSLLVAGLVETMIK